MKKTKSKPVIIETAMGKFLVRDFRPPIPLRTSPRKKKTKLRKEIKRLEEKSFSNKKKKSQIEKVKKRIDFNETKNNDDDNEEEEQEQNSILLIISDDQQDNQLNDEELTNNKCT